MKTQTLELLVRSVEAFRDRISVLEARAIPASILAVPVAQEILDVVLESTGHAKAWANGSLDDEAALDVLHGVREEARLWLRAEAKATLDDVLGLSEKALFGRAKAVVGQFFDRAGKYVREIVAAGLLAIGGPGPILQQEAIADELKKQVTIQAEYLADFRKQIVAGDRPLDGTFVSRAELYGNAAWSGPQEVIRGAVASLGIFDQEMREHIGSDRPCVDCRVELNKGWQPIGTLKKIGDSLCKAGCHCRFWFRKGNNGVPHIAGRGPLIDHLSEFDGKSLELVSCVWDAVLKRYVPCRDARGRFASCNGAPQGTRHPAQDGKPKPGSGGGKKPRKPRKPKEPGDAKPAKPKKEPKPKKPAAEKPPKESKPKEPKPPKEPKTPAEKKPPKEKPSKPEAALPKPAEQPKEPEAPKQSIREAMTSRESGRSKDEVIHEYLVKHQTAPALVQKHGMAEPESMSSIEIDGFRLHYPPPPATFDPAAPVHPTISTIRDYLSFGKDPLPHELARHTSNVYMTTQANKDDRVWQLRYNDPNFASSATGGDGDVVTYKTNRFTKHIVAHEMGHNLAKARYGRVDPTYGGDYANAIRSGEKAPSDYAKMNDAEDFAEAVKGYARDPKHFAGIWPKRAAVLKRMLEDPDYAG